MRIVILIIYFAMALDYFSLKCFLTVAETQNITKSADIVGRTQSAVSQQITRLEMLLGKPLFDRNKDMSLTEDGQLFLLYAKKISALQQEALSHIQDNTIYKTIHFGFSEDLASFFVPHLFEAFNKMHPNILLNMVGGHSADIFEKFSNKSLDICVVKELIENKSVKPKLLYQDDLVWVCQANTDLQKTTDFLPLILSPFPSILTSRVCAILEKHDLKYRLILSSNSFASKLSATEHGMGIMVAPSSHILGNDKLDVIQNLPKLGKVIIGAYSLIDGSIENDLMTLIDNILRKNGLLS